MRTRIVTAAAGTALSLIFATCETYGAATGTAIPQPIRVWMVGTLIAFVVVIATQSVLEQIIAASREQDATRRADEDYQEVRSRLRDTGNGVTYLHPEE